MLPILQLGERSISNGSWLWLRLRIGFTACPILLLKYPPLAHVQSLELSIQAVVLLNMDELLPDMNWRIWVRPPLFLFFFFFFLCLLLCHPKKNLCFSFSVLYYFVSFIFLRCSNSLAHFFHCHFVLTWSSANSHYYVPPLYYTMVTNQEVWKLTDAHNIIMIDRRYINGTQKPWPVLHCCHWDSSLCLVV